MPTLDFGIGGATIAKHSGTLNISRREAERAKRAPADAQRGVGVSVWPLASGLHPQEEADVRQVECSLWRHALPPVCWPPDWGVLVAPQIWQPHVCAFLPGVSPRRRSDPSILSTSTPGPPTVGRTGTRRGDSHLPTVRDQQIQPALLGKDTDRPGLFATRGAH